VKGIVFNILERVVSDAHGTETWDDMLDQAGLDGAYTAVGTYPDSDLMTLVGVASAKLGLPAEDIIVWFGRQAMPVLAERYPAFFAAHTEPRSFVMTLNDVIHPEVRKLYPGAYAPSFEFSEDDQGRLVLGYHSNRDLCSFAEGLVHGAGDHYGQTVAVEHVTCTRRGDDICKLALAFSADEPG
jgi:hypothetical protein